MKTLEIIVFGGGCFWCTEALFVRLRGVRAVTPGYAGGNIPNPTYEMVCSQNTGHVEVIQVEFDPNVLPLEKLLEVFWQTHDPTTPNRQGNDVGSQYRSVILATTDAQKMIAETAKKRLEQSGAFSSPIVTEIQPLTAFFPAEKYHQNYFENNTNQPYCQLVIAPKLKKFLKKYS